jgi:hypothetical protein
VVKAIIEFAIRTRLSNQNLSSETKPPIGSVLLASEVGCSVRTFSVLFDEVKLKESVAIAQIIRTSKILVFIMRLFNNQKT